MVELSRDVTAGGYWSTSEETLVPGGHVVTLSSYKTTESYCSSLENRMESWVKYTPHGSYQQSQSSEFTGVTPLQSIIESRGIKSNYKGKPNLKYKFRFKNLKIKRINL